MIRSVLVFAILILRQTDCKLLLWSSKKLNLPALKHYTTEDFREILHELENPTLAIFETDFNQIPPVLQQDLQLHSTYLPNTEVNFTGFKAIEHNNDVGIIKEMYKIYNDPFIIFEEKSNRRKRYVLERFSGVLYEDRGTMLYTRRPPVFRREGMFFILSQCNSVNTEIGVNTVLMTLEFDLADNVNVSLQFILIFLNARWTLGTAKLSYIGENIFLKPNLDIAMTDKMSYYCSYEIRFRDIENANEVMFYGMQIQPFCEKEQFSGVQMCKDFMTAAILAILFISAMFTAVFLIGITALADIKSSNRYDTAKVKLLHFEDITR